jgi:hypothetical protein
MDHWRPGPAGELRACARAQIERLVACLGPCASFVKFVRFVVYRTFAPLFRMRDDVDFRQEDVCER